MQTEWWVGAVGAAMVLPMMLGAVIAAEPQPCRRNVLPANVEYFPRDLEQVVVRIYERSPTFRAQCERIGAAGNLRVTVRINTAIPLSCRAFSVIERQRGQIRADVQLPPSSDHSELLAHEFEHVLEQIEGLDLQTLARVRGSGVRALQFNVFESDRAQAAGRIVVAETGGRRRAPAAD